MSFPPASPCHRPHHSLLGALLPLIPPLLPGRQTTGHQRNEAPKVKTSPKAQAPQGQAGLVGEAQAKVSRPQLSRPDTAGLNHLRMTQHILGFLAVLRHPSDTPQGVGAAFAYPRESQGEEGKQLHNPGSTGSKLQNYQGDYFRNK